MALGLTREDWIEFETKFPAADAWMSHRRLVREKEMLTSEKKRLEDREFQIRELWPDERQRLAWINLRLPELESAV